MATGTEATPTATRTSVTSTGTATGETGVGTGSTITGMSRIRRLRSQVSKSFSPHRLGRESFY